MTKVITAERYHDFSCGHRVFGHESKCAHLHGHNYRVHFTCSIAELDLVGRVIDFSVMKTQLCQWLEDRWDHKMLIYEGDPWLTQLQAIDPSVVAVSFNPTAENMAKYLLDFVGPMRLAGYLGVVLTKVHVEETRKCGATASLV